MKEIGGYLELENLINNEYYKDSIALNNGRNALTFLINKKGIKKVYIPYFLCDCIENILIKNNIQFEKYRIDKNFNPIFDKELNEDEYIYIVNYYGQIKNTNIMKLNEKFKNIIIDNTHSFFQNPVQEIDTIYSCRKFFGVPDGAYLISNIDVDFDLKMDISKDRMEHILGRYEGSATDYYKSFKVSDEKFADEEIKKMSRLTHNIMGAIDYEKVKEIRNSNFMFLHKNLNQYNKLDIIVPEGAFSYPFYISNSEEIRKKLISNKIYVATLWPNVLKENKYNSIEYKYAKDIIPLPCDQRYDINDMKFIVNIIKNIILK